MLLGHRPHPLVGVTDVVTKAGQQIVSLQLNGVRSLFQTVPKVLYGFVKTL